MRPPRVRLLTTRVAAGRPTIVARVQDAGAGVDPLSLTLAYRGVLVGASEYDTATGLTLFPLPREARTLPARATQAVISASDYQEGKNINSVGDEILPNTAFKPVTITGVLRAGAHLDPPRSRTSACRRRPRWSSRRPLRVPSVPCGSSLTASRSTSTRSGTNHVYTGSWGTQLAPAGAHVLRAVAIDTAGRQIEAARRVRVCR